jgi:hypothetical protein
MGGRMGIPGLLGPPGDQGSIGTSGKLITLAHNSDMVFNL